MTENKTTTIRLHYSTKDVLDKIGIYGESYEDIILRLIEFYKEG